MKVLHVYKTFAPDDFTGVPRVIHSIAKSLSTCCDNTVLTLADQPAASQPLEVDGYHLYQVKRAGKLYSTDLSISIFGDFRRRAAEADVVHFHHPWPLMDLMQLASCSQTPSVITYHSDIVRQRLLKPIYAPIMHAFLLQADALVATSPNYLKSSPILQRYRQKASVIPIGIAARDAPDVSLVRHWKSKVGEGFFLFIGTFRYYKGLRYLIEAARLNGLRVVIVGSGDVGSLGRNLPDNVTVLGPVSEVDKEALLTLSAAFVFPSHLRSEAFGVALLEAARAGKPMISCEIGTGTSFVNVDGLTGIVVPPANPDALSAAMVQLAGVPGLAAKMGAAAIERYRSHFSEDGMSSKYLQIYQRLAASA
ncbi:glycosyltransferase [Devosia chinhatensis]|uniref:Glycosyltransferase n=1 Tax=Devosia aurantiaca TaxID=2714858 RepID=A0A6M1SQ64_9HYPH|nr:glycosyltransferase [Devosia aurantiaca]